MTIERLAKHMVHEYHACDRVTTLVDFYGFQDRNDRTRAELEAAILAEAVRRSPGLETRYVLPYVQMHEFEALLFSDIEQFEWVQDVWSDQTRKQLQAIRDAFASPEQINDSPQTAPSKRILAVFAKGGFSKVEHGPLIAEAIGLEKMRSQCPAFHAWLSALEAWGR